MRAAPSATFLQKQLGLPGYTHHRGCKLLGVGSPHPGLGSPRGSLRLLQSRPTQGSRARLSPPATFPQPHCMQGCGQKELGRARRDRGKPREEAQGPGRRKDRGESVGKGAERDPGRQRETEKTFGNAGVTSLEDSNGREEEQLGNPKEGCEGQ